MSYEVHMLRDDVISLAGQAVWEKCHNTKEKHPFYTFVIISSIGLNVQEIKFTHEQHRMDVSVWETAGTGVSMTTYSPNNKQKQW